MKYYTIVTQELLDSYIPEAIQEYMNYPNRYEIDPSTLLDSSTLIPYTLKEVCFQIIGELVTGDFVISCQLSKNIYINNHCVQSEITEAQLAMIYAQYGEENVFTDYSNLEFKIIEEDE